MNYCHLYLHHYQIERISTRQRYFHNLATQNLLFLMVHNWCVKHYK